jgi:hypothetical protein
VKRFNVGNSWPAGASAHPSGAVLVSEEWFISHLLLLSFLLSNVSCFIDSLSQLFITITCIYCMPSATAAAHCFQGFLVGFCC